MTTCRSSSEDNIPALTTNNRSRNGKPKSILKKGDNGRFGRNEESKGKRMIRSKSSVQYKRNHSENRNSMSNEGVQRNEKLTSTDKTNCAFRSRHLSQCQQNQPASLYPRYYDHFPPNAQNVNSRRSYSERELYDTDYQKRDIQFYKDSGNSITRQKENNLSSRNAIQIRSRPQTPPTDAFKNSSLRPNTGSNMTKVHSSSKNLIKLPLSSGRKNLRSNTKYQSYIDDEYLKSTFDSTKSMKSPQNNPFRKNNLSYQVTTTSVEITVIECNAINLFIKHSTSNGW